jgi:hypothetical protein
MHTKVKRVKDVVKMDESYGRELPLNLNEPKRNCLADCYDFNIDTLNPPLARKFTFDKQERFFKNGDIYSSQSKFGNPGNESVEYDNVIQAMSELRPRVRSQISFDR